MYVGAKIGIEVPTGMLINGQWLEPAGEGQEFEVINPATDEVIARVVEASAKDAQKALDAAANAQKAWGQTPARKRSDILMRAFASIHEHAADFAALITQEMGKPLLEARGEIAYAGEFLRWFAEEAPRIYGRNLVNPEGTQQISVTKRPVGPCLFITPWNFPLAMAARKIAPALAAGCTVVLKPSELTPLTSLAFAQVLMDAGLPAGVLNVVPTTEAAHTLAPLYTDSRLRKLSFTGSTQVGKMLLRDASQQVLRTSMELGGNAPFLVFADADMDKAIAAAKAAKMRNMGEACTAANRFYVHESRIAEFSSRLATEFAAYRVGDGMNLRTQVGPLITSAARQRIHDLVADAKATGASVLVGGEIPTGVGNFYPPTVLLNPGMDARIAREEIFGPVAPIWSFSSDEEALALANGTEVGLAGYIVTEDRTRIARMQRDLEVGMIGVNQGIISNAAAPFGGIKSSGLGREGGSEGIEEFLETIYTSLELPGE